MSKIQNKQNFVVIHIVSPFVSHYEAEHELQEMMSLIDTYGGGTVVKVIQRRMHPDPSTYIGSGKAEELVTIVKTDKIDVIVVNAMVKPGQLFNIQKLLWTENPLIQVWDRVDLILQIFDKHAHTSEAKLQIELAKMRHMGPRIFGMGMVMSRQGGGIGTRGLGETNTELMKRHWRDQVKIIEEKLIKLTTDRERQREQRIQKGFQTVSIVGYTNAGKTTLFNSLTKKNKLAQNALFATLDATIGKLYAPNLKKELLISDTIGFIQNLPAKLVDAFKSTLMESIHADLLLHVIDMSDHLLHEKINVVEKVLQDLKIDSKPKIYVFNKTDLKTEWKEDVLREQYALYSPIFISAENTLGIDILKQQVELFFMKEPTKV